MTITKYLYIKVNTEGIVSEPFVKLQTITSDRLDVDINVIYADNVCIRPHINDFSKALLGNFFRSPKCPIIIITSKDLTLSNEHTLFDNSNIWVRIVYQGDKNFIKDIKESIIYFNECHRIGLYVQNSAEEYINYHLRIQKENHLSGSHQQVKPNLYASEVLTQREKDKIQEKKRNAEENGIKDISVRILLVDDKIPCTIFKHCICTRNTYPECKLRILKELLKKNDLHRHIEPLWNTTDVEAYCVINPDAAGVVKTKIGSVQVVGVKDIESAKNVLADHSIKFDLILLDYYFHTEIIRYGNELLQFIEEAGQSNEDPQIMECRKKVRSNAGLENRFWIFPITAFAPAFLNHLQCDGISLLTNKWYIYPPTNPIVTPVRFLLNLNEFIGMMVDRSVYSEGNLKTFFYGTCKGFQWNNNGNPEDAIKLYVSYMGSEYRRFIQLYGARLNIARDKDVSLFAESIWSRFYRKANIDDDKKAKLLTLNFLMRKFFYASTYLTDDRNGKEKLRLAWIDLRSSLENYFINSNDGGKQYFDVFCNVFSEFMENIKKD